MLKNVDGFECPWGEDEEHGSMTGRRLYCSLYCPSAKKAGHVFSSRKEGELNTTTVRVSA